MSGQYSKISAMYLPITKFEWTRKITGKSRLDILLITYTQIISSAGA